MLTLVFGRITFNKTNMSTNFIAVISEIYKFT